MEKGENSYFLALGIYCQGIHISDFLKISIENFFIFLVHIIHRNTSFFSIFHPTFLGTYNAQVRAIVYLI